MESCRISLNNTMLNSSTDKILPGQNFIVKTWGSLSLGVLARHLFPTRIASTGIASTEESSARRRVLFESIGFVEQSGGRIEVLLATNLHVIGVGMLTFEIGEIRDAKATADGLQVKLNVIPILFVQSVQKQSGKLVTRWAAEPIAPPNFTQRMNAGVTTAIDLRESFDKFFRVA